MSAWTRISEECFQVKRLRGFLLLFLNANSIISIKKNGQMPAQTSEHLNSLDLWLNNQWSIREEFVIWGCDIVGNIFLNVLLDKKKKLIYQIIKMTTDTLIIVLTIKNFTSTTWKHYCLMHMYPVTTCLYRWYIYWKCRKTWLVKLEKKLHIIKKLF